MVNENLKIEIRPIPGRDKIRSYSENLEFYRQVNTIRPFVNPITNKYDTGLTEDDKKYLKDRGFPYDLNDYRKKDGEDSFWKSKEIVVDLPNSPMFLLPGKYELDFIKWKYLLVSKYIYLSEEELLSGCKPQATHYIYNEVEEEAIKASRLDRKNILVERIRALSPDTKRKFLLILENENAENKSENYLTVKFDELLSRSSNFSGLEELLNVDGRDLALMSNIKLALRKNILRDTSQGVFYQRTKLGYGEEEVLKFLKAPANQQLILEIESKLGKQNKPVKSK